MLMILKVNIFLGSIFKLMYYIFEKFVQNKVLYLNVSYF
jgi:hypothetical protein